MGYVWGGVARYSFSICAPLAHHCLPCLCPQPHFCLAQLTVSVLLTISVPAPSFSLSMSLPISESLCPLIQCCLSQDLSLSLSLSPHATSVSLSACVPSSSLAFLVSLCPPRSFLRGGRVVSRGLCNSVFVCVCVMLWVCVCVCVSMGVTGQHKWPLKALVPQISSTCHVSLLITS